MASSRSRDCTARRIRGGLLATTVLTAAILLHTEPARTQPAPNARPQGGQVVPHLHMHLLGGRELTGGLG